MAVNPTRSEAAHALHLSSMRVEDRPIPSCPRCGFVASEKSTVYGPRSECCGLWSWNRMPLADAGTHEARKHLGPLFSSLAKALGSPQFYAEMRKRVDISRAEEMTISAMNEVTAKKFRAAAEDLMMEMMAGTVVAVPQPRSPYRGRS